MRESDVGAARLWPSALGLMGVRVPLHAYLTATAGAGFVPADRTQSAVLFDAFVLATSLGQSFLSFPAP